MALSDSKAFNPDISEIVEEAYERAGLELRSGYDLRTARRSLNFLMLEWQNRGINLWTIEEKTLEYTGAGVALTDNYLNKSEGSYQIHMGTISLLDLILRINPGNVSTQADYHLSRIAQPTYANIPNKLTLGRPLQYYYQRVEIPGGGTENPSGTDQYSKIELWPIPDEDTKYRILYWRIVRIDDTGILASNTMQVTSRFLPALVAGLAYQIATKRPEVASRIPYLKEQYEELFLQAADEDRVKTSARFVPRSATYR